ncbi:MAG: MFS transporter [Promethearchaeota archaeon]
MNEVKKNEKSINEGEYKIPSTLNTISYGSAGFWMGLAYGVFNAYIFFFYEVVVGLDTIFIFLAMLIFTLWDAVNDPLIGHLTDRITRFTRKHGKRFIWIVMGIIPANFVLALVYMPPAVDAATNPFPLFVWIIFTTCLFDSLTTLCFVNVDALFPDKFRNDSARRKARGWGTPLSMLALPVANIVPPILLGVFGGMNSQASYVSMVWIIISMILPISILCLPGMRENKELIDRYYISEKKPGSFIEALKSTLKQKSFVYYIILFFGFMIVTGSLTASIPYAANFVLLGTGSPELDMILLFALFLNGALISVPFWIWFAKKNKNNKQTAVIGGILLVMGSFLTTFYIGVIDSMIYMFILGFTMGNLWVLTTIYFSDVLDERVVLTHSDVRGATVGVVGFLSRLSRGAQISIFALIHILTGFVEGSTTQPPLAQFGIRLHMSVIPAIILLICTIIFWKKYPLTPEKTLEIKKQLKELGF